MESPRYHEHRGMSIRELDTAKKWFRCLRCGRKIWTDRCHRFCSRCADANANVINVSTIRMKRDEYPITLSEIACYGLDIASVQTFGEIDLAMES